MTFLHSRSRARKFNNIPVERDGIRFDSKMEAARYDALRLLERGGEIRGLEVHPRFPIAVNKEPICTYVADFAYAEPRDDGSWRQVVEDVKGDITPAFRLKHKLMQAVLNIAVRLVDADGNPRPLRKARRTGQRKKEER